MENHDIKITCTMCRNEKIIPMTAEQYIQLEEGLLKGEHIQDAVPDLDPEWREMFLSGICPDCWKNNIASMEI